MEFSGNRTERINQIITDIDGSGKGETREFIKPDDTPSAYGGSEGIVKVDKKNDPDGKKAFEKALAAKAAGLGFPPKKIAKAMRK